MPGPRAGGVPRVLLGDFNTTLDHREIRGLLRRSSDDRPGAAAHAELVLAQLEAMGPRVGAR